MIAIVIPYFKLTFFEETLQSLADQTDQRFKVYIGDDASPESPDELLEQYQGQFNLSYHRFNDNLGGISLTQQWERCIALTENEKWVMILGDDDVLELNVVQAFYKHLETVVGNEIKVVRFSTIVINENNEPLSEIHIHPQIESSANFINRKFSKTTRSSLSEYIFHRKTLIEGGFANLPLAWHSDDLAVIDMGVNGIYSINNICVLVRTSKESITGKNGNVDQKAAATLLFIFNHIFKKTGINAQTTLALEKRAQYAIYETQNVYFFFKLGWHYVKNFKFLKLLKFNYFYLKNRFNARN